MYYVIKRPLVTEKNSILAEKGVYAFEVEKTATKSDIKMAVEKYFRVKVAAVNTAMCRGRAKRTKFGVSKPV
nr:50S ribosomal protein L23 [Bdellovibrionales bacterium]